jgi:hypothetical protein
MASANLPAAPTSQAAPRFRRTRNKVPSAAAPSRPAPKFDLGTPGAPTAPAGDAARQRVQRARVPTPARPSRPTMAAAGLGVPGMGKAPRAPATPLPAAPGRTPTPAPHAAARDDRRRDPRLRGVPLGSLAACVSDRLEDSLKQKVIAAVTTQKECVSEAGTYRFVETRNLNSFLMTIERAGSRAEGDRCTELRHALECLN